MVGAAAESRAAHLDCHTCGRRDCPRCQYYRLGWKLARRRGRFEVPGGSKAVVWLSERPAYLPWPCARGCSLCAGLLRRISGTSAGEAAKFRLINKWALYAMRAKKLQSAHIVQHAVFTECHRAAEEAFLNACARRDRRASWD